MRVLDLFSGIGGFSLGLERAGMTTVGFCEIEPFPRDVLKKHWPNVPCHDDITTRVFTEGEADVVCGGFPCQDISNAGKRAGITGERSGLWKQLVRAIRVVRPKYAIVENVAALLGRGMGTVLGDLAASGYDAEWDCIPASFVGAPQARDRVWVVAYPNRRRRKGRKERYGEGPILVMRDNDDRLAMAQRRAREATSRICRMDDGLPNGIHRLRSLGNAVVPQVVELIGRAIMQVDQQTKGATDEA